MGNNSSSQRRKGRQERGQETHRCRRHDEGSNVPRSSTQRVYNDHISYGTGDYCNLCRVECDNFADHIKTYHPELNPEDFQALLDRNEPVRPQNGKEMHPSNRAFSKHNIMTPSGVDEEQVPLNREKSEQPASSNTSRSATSSNTTHEDEYLAGGYETEEELAAENWVDSGPSTPRQGSLCSEAPFSGFSSPPRGETARAYSQDFFRKSVGRNTPEPLGNRPGSRGASQDSRIQQRRDSIASSSTSASYPSTRSTISPPPPPPARVYRHPRAQVQPLHVPHDDQVSKRDRSGCNSPVSNSSRRSGSRSRRDREPIGGEHVPGRHYPPQSSERTTQWHRRKREPPRSHRSPESEAEVEVSRRAKHDDTGARVRFARRDGSMGPSREESRDEHSRVSRMPYQGEAVPSKSTTDDEAIATEKCPRREECMESPRTGQRREASETRTSQHYDSGPSRSARYEDFSVREQYPRRDENSSPSRTGHRREPSRTRMSQQPEPGPSRTSRYGERFVFPGDESLFSRSYLQEMGSLRLSGPREFDGREGEGEFHDEYDSDDHMYSRKYLREMAGTRGGEAIRSLG